MTITEEVMVALISGLCVAVADIIVAMKAGKKKGGDDSSMSRELAEIRQEVLLIKQEIKQMKKDFQELNDHVKSHNNLDMRISVIENEYRHVRNSIEKLEK